jgi:hypothetical protein
VTEADLLVAVSDWYLGHAKQPPAREVLLKALSGPPLHCKRVMAKGPPDGRLRYEYRRIALRSAETSAHSEAAERLRAESGLQITVASLFGVMPVSRKWRFVRFLASPPISLISKALLPPLP